MNRSVSIDVEAGQISLEDINTVQQVRQSFVHASFFVLLYETF